MSEVIALSGNGRAGETAKMRIGLLRLTDAAPVIVAHEFGFFADEGVDAELPRRTSSWANIADKLAYGFLDAAAIVPPLAFAIELGLRGTPQRLVIPASISLGGNTITLSRGLANQVRMEAADRGGLSGAAGIEVCLGSARGEPSADWHCPCVFDPQSLIALLAGDWRDRPQPRCEIDCRAAGPCGRGVGVWKNSGLLCWCAVGRYRRPGGRGVHHRDLQRRLAECAWKRRSRYERAGRNKSPDALRGAVRALLRCCPILHDAPEKSTPPIRPPLLIAAKYLDVDSHAIMSSLPGGAIRRDNVSTFYANAATFPWLSHALWFLREMARWGLIEPGLDLPAIGGAGLPPTTFTGPPSHPWALRSH